MTPTSGYVTVATDVPSPVQFNPLRPAGIRLLGALDAVARALGLILEITCGSNGHALDDPHTVGEAFDVRSHTFEYGMRMTILRGVLEHVATGGMDLVVPASDGLATLAFFGFLEDARTPNEHFHFQRRKGTVFPVLRA